MAQEDSRWWTQAGELPEVSKGWAEEGEHPAPEAGGERWGDPGPVR